MAFDARAERNVGNRVDALQRAADRADAVAEFEVTGRLHFVHRVRAGLEVA